MRQKVLLLALFSALLVSACRGRTPYEGKSVAALERMLRDPNPTVQAQGAYGLSRLGPDARSAVPSLIAALKKSSAVRQNAALALAQMGHEARDAVPALGEALGDSEWAVRRQAALALGKIGPQAQSAVPALQRLSRDPDRLVRSAAQEALKEIRSSDSGDTKR
jgi:HEAT repeat protein